MTITIAPNSTEAWGHIQIGGASMVLPYHVAVRIDDVVRPLICDRPEDEGVLKRLEREAITHAILTKNGETYQDIADRLGISKKTLSYKRTEYGLP